MSIRRTLASLALLTLPSAADAQVDLTWDNCVVPGVGEAATAINKTFDCGAPQEYRLYVSFKTPIEMPSFAVMDASIDLVWSYESTYPMLEPLEPFWHLEATGCNASGIGMTIDQSPPGGPGPTCGALVNPWGAHGDSAVFGEIIAYAPDYLGQPGFGRLIISIALDPRHGRFSLHPGVNYYAFTLIWNTDQAGTCAGCADRMVVTAELKIYQLDDQPTMVVLTHPDKMSNTYVVINPGDYPVPAPTTTWGQIKSLYR